MVQLKKGLLFIVSSPSGAGKTTLVEKLCREVPQCKRSITCTTREKRAHEIEGKDYIFLSKDEFVQKEHKGEFLESALVFSHYYGTLKRRVEETRLRGEHVFLVIDTQGALELKNRIDATLIFIHPPSLEELKKRLEGRATEKSSDIALRLSWAKEECDKAKHYDYQIVNDDLENAYQILKSIVVAETHKTAHILKS